MATFEHPVSQKLQNITALPQGSTLESFFGRLKHGVFVLRAPVVPSRLSLSTTLATARWPVLAQSASLDSSLSCLRYQIMPFTITEFFHFPGSLGLCLSIELFAFHEEFMVLPNMFRS